MAWDASFKNILKRFLTSETTTVITETEVPTANLRIDFVITRSEPLIPPFHVTDKSTIIGEFKSERDIFNLTELRKSIAKVYLYATNAANTDGSQFENSCLFYFIASSSTVPKKIQDVYAVHQIEEGIFKLEHDIDIYLVLMNQLQYTDDNSFLGLFGSQKIRYQTIKGALRKRQNFIVSIAYFLYKEEVRYVSDTENLEIDPITQSIRSVADELGIPFLINEIGLAKVIEEVGLAKVIEEVGLAKVIEEVGLAKVIGEVGLAKVIEELSKLTLTDEEKHKLRELLDKNS